MQCLKEKEGKRVHPIVRCCLLLYFSFARCWQLEQKSLLVCRSGKLFSLPFSFLLYFFPLLLLLYCNRKEGKGSIPVFISSVDRRSPLLLLLLLVNKPFNVTKQQLCVSSQSLIPPSSTHLGAFNISFRLCFPRSVFSSLFYDLTRVVTPIKSALLTPCYLFVVPFF